MKEYTLQIFTDKNVIYRVIKASSKEEALQKVPESIRIWPKEIVSEKEIKE